MIYSDEVHRSSASIIIGRFDSDDCLTMCVLMQRVPKVISFVRLPFRSLSLAFVLTLSLTIEEDGSERARAKKKDSTLFKHSDVHTHNK